ncbi:MAG: DUF3847 domain-containing protein [Eubacteriales bacterium]|nr:DUF3847 domain-containing protein [Eubacteriales bacterium]
MAKTERKKADDRTQKRNLKRSIEEQILLKKEKRKQVANEIKRYQNKLRQQERKERTKRLIEKGAVFESLFPESISISKDDFYQLLVSLNNYEPFRRKLKELEEKQEDERDEVLHQDAII